MNYGTDGNLAALDRYEREQSAFDAWEASMEVESERQIEYMTADEEWRGKECHCCGHPITEFGKIKAHWGTCAEEIDYRFYCKDCVCC